jgi:hypothetical protein
MKKQVITSFLIILVLIPILSGCIEDDTPKNNKPVIKITYPHDNNIVSSIVKITGTAFDPDERDSIQYVEIKINSSDWEKLDETNDWSYDWNTYKHKDGKVLISARAFDGKDYSELDVVSVSIDNLIETESQSHRWAVFVIAANYPENNESKLGNGGLILAEEIAAYFIENLDYPTSNVFILFDDGWIREDNGYGERIETLQQRSHQYDIHYSGATQDNVETIIDQVLRDANHYADSEVFLWFAGHGAGDNNNELTGGKILERSSIFLWDSEIYSDREMGDLLYSLRSDKTCIIVDACFSGGFADRTIYDFPTFFLINSGIPGPGRVVMTGASKYRSGFASTTRGPLFTLLWFEGLRSGDADGYKSGIRETGKPSILGLRKDGKVSVEEAFYYARYVLKNDDTFQEYDTMEPQINDQYPHRGIFRSNSGLILGE